MVHTAVGYARHAQPARRARVHDVDRAGRDEHGHRRRARDREPAAGAAAPRRRLRLARGPTPCCSSSRTPSAGDVSVNDCFRPVSRYFDRIWRPEQVVPAALQAMRVLVNQAETGAVTLALPAGRAGGGVRRARRSSSRSASGTIPRPLPDEAALARAVELIRAAQRPLIVAGGGVIYSEATEALRALCEQTGIPVGETQAGKGSLPYDHPSALGAIGVTGTFAANRIAAEADLVIGVGTRWSRLHDGLEDRVPQPRRPLRQRQRRRLRRREARRARARRRRARDARAARRAARRLGGRRRLPRARPRG